MIRFILCIAITLALQSSTQAFEKMPHKAQLLSEMEDAALLLAGPNNLISHNYQTPPIYSINKRVALQDQCSLVPLDIKMRGTYIINFRCKDLMNYLKDSHQLYLSGNVLGRLKGSFLLVSSQNIDDTIYLRWDISNKNYTEEDGLVAEWVHEQRLKGKYVLEILFL